MALHAKLTFQPASGFQGELKKRVDAYFESNGICKYANRLMVAKTVFWLVFTWSAWATTLLVPTSLPVMLALFAVQGFGFACIGFNIGHDAIHGGYSKNLGVNQALSWCFDVMGASSATWSISHNVVHHTYTNIQHVDGDLEPGPWMVFYPQKTHFWHRFQHLYAWFLYCFVGVIWMYVKDFQQLGNKDPLTGKAIPASAYFQLFMGKLLHLALLLAIPMALIQAPLWHVMVGYVVFLAAAGFTLAIVFQLAHCVEGVVFPRVPAEASAGAAQMPEAWAEHQMKTTANFGKTWMATWICGGLDHQIEHHLFPRICHVHYPALAPIVRRCAEEHGLPYVHNGSFVQAVGVHARTLKKLGTGIDVEAFEAAGAVVPAE
jgi:linoleoyl-CoA desaturase